MPPYKGKRSRSAEHEAAAAASPLLTLNEFCARNKMSKTTLYKLRLVGLGPVVMPFSGGRISLAAEAEWHAMMEQRAGLPAATTAFEQQLEVDVKAAKAAISKRQPRR
jgi:hypothetical protein